MHCSLSLSRACGQAIVAAVPRLLSLLFWSVLPAAFIGPGTVTSAASAGALFGTSLLWALVFSTVATIVLQEMAARLTIASGLELGEAIARRHGLWLRLLAGGAVILGCAAYEAGNFAGTIRGVQLLHDAPRSAILLVSAATAIWLLWSTSTVFVARLLGILVAIMGVCFIYAAIALRPHASELLAGALVPRLPEGSSGLAIALIGTTVVPYNLFLGSSLARGRELMEARRGIAFAVAIGGIISGAILLVGAAMPGPMDFDRLAELLRSRLGSAGAWTLGVGLAAAGFSSAITAPMAAAFTARAVFGDRERAEWAQRGKYFRAVWLSVLGFGAAIGLSQLPIVPVIVTAQIVNGLLLPLSALFLLLAMNAGGPLPMARRNGLIANLGGGLVLLTTTGLGLRAILRALGLGALVLIAGCGSPKPPPMLLHVTVSATPLVEELVAIWQPTSPDAPSVQINSASSRELVAQLQQGAPGDLVLLAAPAAMQELVDAGRVAAAQVSTPFHSKLVLLARQSNALQDLMHLRIGLGEAGVPVGDYARDYLRASGHLEAVEPSAIILPNEAALVAALTQGALDAAFVYASSALRAPLDFARIELDPALCPTVSYSIAALSPAGAEFIRFLASAAAREIIERHGLRPTP